MQFYTIGFVNLSHTGHSKQCAHKKLRCYWEEEKAPKWVELCNLGVIYLNFIPVELLQTHLPSQFDPSWYVYML